MDQMLKLQHEVETCIALAEAVSAMLCEIADTGGNCSERVDHAGVVLGVMQERLDTVRRMANEAIIKGL